MILIIIQEYQSETETEFLGIESLMKMQICYPNLELGL